MGVRGLNYQGRGACMQSGEVGRTQGANCKLGPIVARSLLCRTTQRMKPPAGRGWFARAAQTKQKHTTRYTPLSVCTPSDDGGNSLVHARLNHTAVAARVPRTHPVAEEPAGWHRGGSVILHLCSLRAPPSAVSHACIKERRCFLLVARLDPLRHARPHPSAWACRMRALETPSDSGTWPAAYCTPSGPCSLDMSKELRHGLWIPARVGSGSRIR